MTTSFEDAVDLNAKLKHREAELEKAKEAAERANSRKTKFLATMSHEIRTPMSGILGLLELLSLSKLDRDQQAVLSTVLDSSKSLLRIIEDILDFSHIEAGHLELTAKPVSLDNMVKKLYNLYSSLASKRGLVLEFGCDSKISPALQIDEVRLEQILSNCIDNAIKNTAKGCVEMRVDRLSANNQSEKIRFTIRDTGSGMLPEIQAALLQKSDSDLSFNALDSNQIGLGLLICRTLVNLMQGEISINTVMNKGTTLTLIFEFPLSQAEALVNSSSMQKKTQLGELLANRRAPPTIEAAEREGSLILVAEDSPVNRKLLLRQLHLLGYAAVGVGNGSEALNEMRLHQYAMVITDCNMPTMDGYELAMHIRKAESYREKPIQIIAYTANALDSAAETCTAVGMDAFLLKPVEIQTLMEFLDERLPIPSAAPIDFNVLYGIIGTDQTLIQEVLLTFKRTNRRDSETLINALGNGDSHEVMHWAHRIKGASQMVGAHNLANICAEIELYCRETDTSKFNDFKKRYEQEMRLLHQFLETI